MRIECKGLGKRFRAGRAHTWAVKDLNLDLDSGTHLGIVGESGSGKTTLARLLTNLERPTTGEILVDSTPLHELRELSRSVQMIFQDPFSSLNPAHSIGYAIRRTIELQHGVGRAEALGRSVTLLERVGLTPGREMLHRFPKELSGGQRQRVSVARSLGASPTFVVADEPTSMLDVSVGMEVLNLLLEVAESGVTYILITHDLAVARYIADRIVVMYRGEIVEDGPADAVIQEPLHPYTRLLAAVTPRGSRVGSRERVAGLLGPSGDLAATEPVPGWCTFAQRCPHKTERCVAPVALRSVGGHLVRCTLYEPSAPNGAVVSVRVPTEQSESSPVLPEGSVVSDVKSWGGVGNVEPR